MNQSDQPVAIVTGAGSGIGRATALAIAQRGYRIQLVGRTPATLEETGRLIGGDPGTRWTARVGDVGDAPDAERMIENAFSAFGRLDALVNNAGWTELVSIADATPDFVDRVFRVNAVGPVCACAAAVRAMRSGGRGGVIVNVSSMSTRDPFPGLGIYGAAKAAVETLAKAIATEHGPRGGDAGIRAYCIGPGAVETPMLRSLFGTDVLPADQTLAPVRIAREIVACVTGETDMTNGETRYIVNE